MVGVAGGSDKKFKINAHRRERRAVKVSIETGNEPPNPKEFGNPWDSQKDGKMWIGSRCPKGLRK